MNHSFKQCILTFFLGSCFIISINGQTEKGRVLLGGQTNLTFLSKSSSWKTDDGSGEYYRTRYLEITPQIGYFLSNNLLAGILVPLSYKKEFEDYYSLKSSSIDFVPLLQLYFSKSKVKPYIYGALGTGFGKIINDDPDFPSPVKYNTISFIWDVGAGAAFFLNNNVSIDLGFGYAYNSDNIKSKSPIVFDPERKDIDKGFLTEIGVYVYLR